jgi:hypothetical protein
MIASTILLPNRKVESASTLKPLPDAESNAKIFRKFRFMVSLFFLDFVQKARISLMPNPNVN